MSGLDFVGLACFVVVMLVGLGMLVVALVEMFA
jgi:hypothetical protein